MAKSLSRFFCKECGYETIKWLGQCPSCKRWNTMVEAPKELPEKNREHFSFYLFESRKTGEKGALCIRRGIPKAN